MRIRIYRSILTLFMMALLCALIYTQVAKHEKYRVMSEENRLKVVPLMAPRGSISDRNGNVMVKDVLSFDVSVIYSRLRDSGVLSEKLSSVLNIPKEEILSGIKKGRRNPYVPVCVVRDIGMEKAVQVEEIGMDHPGLLLEVASKREYIYGRSAANLLGYMGFINRSEFDRLRQYGYSVNDLIGRDGVEKQYDEYLRGRHGGKQIEVDHLGRESMLLGFKEPVPGKDVTLTVNSDLQVFCDELLTGKKGAIIALDPQTGQILAMASSPSYDPGVFVDRSDKKDVNHILKDKNYPLINRAITGSYPPGSVFKMVTATGVLEKHIIQPGTTFECPGYLKLGKARFRCWREKGHGILALQDAIKGSCNVYFFNLGLLLGADSIAEFAAKFGFGKNSEIDLPGETPGMLPSPDWKRKRYNEMWYKGDTLNYTIGQGYLLVSPLQVAEMMSVFANNGYLVRPYVVEEVGGVTVNSPKKVSLDISEGTLDVIREGLKKVVNDRRGTGIKAKSDDVVVAGKTGTAQTSKGKNHGWFAGFAPFEEAKITVVVFDEYGGKGGYYAAETAGEVIQKARELGII